MEVILSAVITGAVSIAICVISNNANNAKTRALMEYKMTELTKQVEKHNGIIERTFKLEGQMKECQHDIRDLKAYNKPE